jgi:hypothetical protein
MSSFTFDYAHIVMGMVSCLHVIAAFAVLVQMQADESVETPRDVIQQMFIGRFESTTSLHSGEKESARPNLKAPHRRR